MYPTVTEADLARTAHRLGFAISAEELPVYRRHLLAGMAAFDAFVANGPPDELPPVEFGRRAPGRRPSAAEDPLGAWAWMCRIEGAPDGLLSGKTVSFKDNTAMAGLPVSFGTSALDGLIADIDATVVTRVLRSGATITGKNTMVGLGGGRGFGGDYGDEPRPLNPHDHSRIPGGSSTGSAIAVADHQVDISFGGDQGGSIRIPAALCGVLGLKPTFGLVSHFGIMYLSDQSVDHTGPLARSAEDVALALQAVAGADGLDPRQDSSVPNSVDVLGALDGGVRGLRIGLLAEGFAECEGKVAAAVHEAVAVLGDLGAEVVPISVPEHATALPALMVLLAHGGRLLADGGFFGAHARTCYPPELAVGLSRAPAVARRCAASAGEAQPAARRVRGAGVVRPGLRQGAQRPAALRPGFR